MNLNPLKLLRSFSAWFKEGISPKARILIIVFLLLFSVGSLYAAYKVNDYFENNPNACFSCHVHDEANKAWVVSEHAGINCHECHHSTKLDQIRQLFNFAVLGHNKVSPRHGEVIVPWKLCFGCHWEKNEKFPNAPDISKSVYHAKHAFIEKIECTKCHGYRTHKFTIEERYCVTCHKDKEMKPHGEASDPNACAPMGNLPCLNCHTDRMKDLRPGRKKCLYCHGGEQVRKELIADATIDVKHFQPSPEIIRKAIKIQIPKNAAMQFHCYECHNPHVKARPDWSNCLAKCHSNVPNVGKHELHIQMDMKCKDCHKPHGWKVTPEQAKQDCAKCHEYRDPKAFLK
ncbi:MAG: hypothetical protein OHK006_24610 [Thermodesulfovibrionales bacterium]